MQMVLDAEGLTHREASILLIYCNYTDPHGYVWAGVERIADDSKASPSTVKRARADLMAKNLLATRRRVDPRTGESIPNLTRVNLPLLASMKRAPKEYDDNIIEALTFEEPPRPLSAEVAADQAMDQDDPGSDLRMDQDDPAPGRNMTPPYGGINMTPNPSGHPSGSSSSGVTADTGPAGTPGREDEEEPRPEKTDAASQPSVLGIVTGATDATPEEAQALIEELRPEATKSLIGYVRHLAGNGDLGHRLWRMRQDTAAQAPPRPRPGEGATCSEHGQALPCLACRMDVMGGDTDVVERLLAEHGPQERPDLARMLQPAGGVR